MTLVAVAVWAIVGLIFWVPMLARSSTVFSMALLPAALLGRDVEPLRGALRHVSGFYFRGFEAAFGLLHEPRDTGYLRGADHGSISFGGFLRLLIESVWTIVFWALVLFVFHPEIVDHIRRLAPRP